ncbi:MAG: hypothetical protein ACXVRZ_04125 [Gaiellaceae bacterium]
MQADGVDAEKLEILRRWGGGLQNDPRAEVAAAGRAIQLLIDEIERLHVLAWDGRLYPDPPLAPPSGYDALASGDDARPSLHETLWTRLLRRVSSSGRA